MFCLSLEGTPSWVTCKSGKIMVGMGGYIFLNLMLFLSQAQPSQPHPGGKKQEWAQHWLCPTQGRQCSVWATGSKKGPGESSISSPGRSQWESRPWLGFTGQRGWAPAQGNLATFLFSFLFPSCISLAQPTCSNSALSSSTYRHSSTSDCFCSSKTGWKMWKFTLPQDRKVKELQKK